MHPEREARGPAPPARSEAQIVRELPQSLNPPYDAFNPPEEDVELILAVQAALDKRAGERRWACSLQLLCDAITGLWTGRDDPLAAAEMLYRVADGLAVLVPARSGLSEPMPRSGT